MAEPEQPREKIPVVETPNDKTTESKSDQNNVVQNDGESQKLKNIPDGVTEEQFKKIFEGKGYY